MNSKSKNKEYLKLGVIVLVFLFILGGFLLYVSYPLLSTKKVVLATQPVDPFDILRGQYMTIRYEIGNIPLIRGAQVGNQVYVTLLEDTSGISRYESSSLDKPLLDELFIRGRIISISEDSMRLEYGIEQYFFERNARIEAINIDVEIKLSDNGGARIFRLLKDGQPVNIIYENKTYTS
ncbi:GDYXXLXY domain-containing protein [Candidatus Pacearchaeota archaeon]|nr:GDYXXLXY domain-containing protein [Candidatus Pacearchaeota archaeon]